jgi:hypothetical protein
MPIQLLFVQNSVKLFTFDKICLKSFSRPRSSEKKQLSASPVRQNPASRT